MHLTDGLRKKADRVQKTQDAITEKSRHKLELVIVQTLTVLKLTGVAVEGSRNWIFPRYRKGSSQRHFVPKGCRKRLNFQSPEYFSGRNRVGHLRLNQHSSVCLPSRPAVFCRVFSISNLWYIHHMKLLLTSTGITNKTIENKFIEMVGKQPEEMVVAYIPTAMNVARPTDKRWIVNNIVQLDQMKIGKIDLLDFSAVPEEIWLPRLKQADVIMVGGGNPYHLIYSMRKAGLDRILKGLIEEKIYVGCSAGSVILGKDIVTTAPKKYCEEIPEFEGDNGLKYVDFSIRPHFYNPDRPQYTDETTQELANNFQTTFYAIDDNSAIAVEEGEVEVVSEGRWKKIEPIVK